MLKYTTVVCRDESADLQTLEQQIATMESGAHAMGSRIWELTAKAMTINNICKILERQFEISEEDCYEETKAFLQKLVELKAVKITESSQTKKFSQMPRSKPQS